MRRRLFTIASAVSLLLCIATVVLWVRSYWVGNDPFKGKVMFYVDNTSIGSGAGQIQFTRWRSNFSGEMLNPRMRWGGFSYDENPVCLRVLVPYWSLVAMLLIMPAAWFITRSPRHAGGTCCLCSYNLTGNISGVCPECGTATTEKPVGNWPNPS